MPFWKMSARDVTGFKFLFSLVFIYALMSAIVYSVLHMKFISPLPANAPLERFSEARAVEHIRVLAEEIDGRQEGRPGLKEAATYIKSQLEMVKERAGPNLRVEVEETQVDGSFSMMFLGHSISLGYRNHTNILMRISSMNSLDTDASVLMNAHYDSPVNSPGAGDCGSCVASLLELARLVVDSGWVPPQPVIFLFNGAEELFMLGSHGFMTKHKLKDTIGAFINVEASGTGGIDLVCQSGPGSWPSYVYSQAAVYPMAQSSAQDVFPVIPGDTDYRMFAEDYADIPGLDIIFLLGGYYYHTTFDTVDRIVPGSMQARGENLISVLKAFASSSRLKVASERKTLDVDANSDMVERAVFFDYLTWFMVFYPRRVAFVLHNIPAALFLCVPFFLYMMDPRTHPLLSFFWAFFKGVMHHFAGILLGVIVPVLFAVIRLFFAYPMSWFAHSYLAFLMFIPCSFFGLLIPRAISDRVSHFQGVSSKKIMKEPSDEARFWGAFGFYAFATSAYFFAGLNGGFMTFVISISMLLGWIAFYLSVKSYGYNSIKSPMFYVIALVPCLLYSLYFGGILTLLLIEKTGMMGAIPPPYGFYLADVAVAAVIGIVTGLCLGPIIPICDRWLAKSSILKFLLHFTVVMLAVSSQFFPYSKDAPKRVVLQHTFISTGGNEITGSSYDLAVIDSNSMEFIFKHAPEVAKELHVGPSFSLGNAEASPQEAWMALFPISCVLTTNGRFPAKANNILERYSQFPLLQAHKPQTTFENGTRRVHLELSLGLVGLHKELLLVLLVINYSICRSLEEIWVTVLNITGPLSGWSFADGKPPAPELPPGGPPSYILRLSGNSDEKWNFWLEASSEEEVRVDVAVLDQRLDEETIHLKGLFPKWSDVIAYTSFLSTYLF
ncbi:Zn-dependent exopeptidases superfamily protein [Arabidopsis thaliana]|uniref:Zn-dependent exopeptidases superfamily protein n=1 Tax=Arabidopsis thaliana TaxID=3702 RepID=A0A1P8ASK2_ARATH|nr:Zn-dependent exopeptidases superfamily protein [Arabidopsis thaliana]ANM59636.1 Zn-dependent exopeptidases superfamily protein [Arabidopsis thaliana]|eukprot:NP_001321980.1 Zn-dependent exopeptidases superfamily protein [Arabidopsis thaliana]